MKINYNRRRAGQARTQQPEIWGGGGSPYIFVIFNIILKRNSIFGGGVIPLGPLDPALELEKELAI